MLEAAAQNQQPVATDERSAAATCMLWLVDPARAASMVRRSARPLAVGAAPDAPAAAQELRDLLGATGLTGAEYFVQQRERASTLALQAAAVRVPSMWLTLLSHGNAQDVRRCCTRAGTAGLCLMLAHMRDEGERSRILACAGESASVAALSGVIAGAVRERGAASLAAVLWACLSGLEGVCGSGSGAVGVLGAAMFGCAWRRLDAGDAALLAHAARWDVPRLFEALECEITLTEHESWAVLLRLLQMAAAREDHP